MVYIRIGGMNYDYSEHKFMQNIQIKDGGNTMLFVADVFDNSWNCVSHFNLFEITSDSGSVSYSDVGIARGMVDDFFREAECLERQGTKPYVDQIIDIDKYIEAALSGQIFEGTLKTEKESAMEDEENKVVHLKYPAGVSGLAGFDEGKKDYREQIGDRDVTTVIFPAQIQLISSSYVSGFFSAFADKYGINHIKENIKIISENSEQVRAKIISDLY